MQEKKSSSDAKSATDGERAAKDKQAAKVLWWILMILRVVIPAYMLYVVYLYFTTPIPPNLQGPR